MLKSVVLRRLAVGMVAASTLGAGLLVPVSGASAAAATKCTVAQARAQKLRFNYENGTIQICARVGNAYRWRKASNAEAQRPYRGFLLPMANSIYVPVVEEVTSAFVVELAGLLGNSRDGSLFAGFVTAGISHNASVEEIDALLIVLPFTAAGRAVADPVELLDAIDGEQVLLAGKTVKLSADGETATITYVGPTGMVLFVGDVANADSFVDASDDYLRANAGI
jgi:hypothetical protein